MIYTLAHAQTNPTIEYAQEILKQVRDGGYTSIVSKGGGSTIDVGKYIAVQLNIPHHAIPTTAGTGSEVSKYCVLTVDGKKKSFTGDEYIPTSYELNPKNVITCPADFTLSAGLDAFCQAIESIWSNNATGESESYAEAAINLIENNLFKSFEDLSNQRYRMNMLIAANLSGRAINIARTNVCHAISYVLTELYQIPHGIACAMTLRYFARKAGTPVDDFLDKFWLPKYMIDPAKVADIAIQHEKMKDVDFEVTREDIIEALCL